MANFICFDLEGPLSPQDNAYELMKRFPNGDKVFEVISRYDDLLTLEEREGYEPGDTLEAVNLARELKPDVIIAEAHMPKMSSVEAIRRIKTEHPQTAILILTMDDEEEYIAELLRAGAAGCLLKTISSEDLVQAIRSVRAGEFVSNTALMQRLLKRAARPQPVALDYGEHMTRRETEVLELAARMGNREVAAHLGITERTVKGHLTNIFQKLNVASRTQAVLGALRHDWISLEDK